MGVSMLYDGLLMISMGGFIFLSLYLCGCLLSFGMLIGSGFITEAIEDIKDGYDFWGYIRTTLFQLFRFLFFIIFSWATVGYIYTRLKIGKEI